MKFYLCYVWNLKNKKERKRKGEKIEVQKLYIDSFVVQYISFHFMSHEFLPKIWF